LQLARLVKRITRNVGEKRLTGAVYLDVAKAFDTVWIDGLLCKLTLLNFPSFIVQYYFIVPPGPGVPNLLPDVHVFSSWHEFWGGSG
jgi:hypothetical protein